MTNPPQPGQPWQIPEPAAPNLPGSGEVTPAGSGRARARRAVSPKLILALILGVAVIWFVIANNHRAKITLWVHSYYVPLWLVLLCTFIVGMLVDRLIRRRKKKPQS